MSLRSFQRAIIFYHDWIRGYLQHNFITLDGFGRTARLLKYHVGLCINFQYTSWGTPFLMSLPTYWEWNWQFWQHIPMWHPTYPRGFLNTGLIVIEDTGHNPLQFKAMGALPSISIGYRLCLLSQNGKCGFRSDWQIFRENLQARDNRKVNTDQMVTGHHLEWSSFWRNSLK